MSNYQAPLRDMRFVIHELVGSAPICALPAYADCDAELIDAVLEEAGRFAGDILSPLNPVGDRDGARWQPGADGKGEVLTVAGFAAAYKQFADGGWMALPCPPEHGGQGLPRLLAVAVSEMWKSANLSFSHVVTLTHGAIEALMIAGSDDLKATWLPRLVTGEWTGTMNITEPQAGSDLAAISCRAVPQADGSFRINGQKIFITYGDHDMAANIVHLVLARTPDAPAGVKGLSLFLVPKFILDADGNPGEHNDVYCTSIEHKLGVHGSPTTTLVHGDHGGSTGYLIGELGRGLETMFVMMNSARLSVGTEGLGVAQRAWQLASEYAKERIQGTDMTQKSGERVAIVRHPDVRRLLMQQRAHTEAIRALAYSIAALQDVAHQADDAAARDAAHRRVELLTPVLKGWSTESAVELTSLAIQIFGGMGFVEETGIAQYMRDARITPIYEGTTAIQAADLAGRKIARDGGKVLGPDRRHARRRSPPAGFRPRHARRHRRPARRQPRPSGSRHRRAARKNAHPTRRRAGGGRTLPQAARHGSRRLADGQSRTDRHPGHRRRQHRSVLPREDRLGEVLRRPHSDPQLRPASHRRSR